MRALKFLLLPFAIFAATPGPGVLPANSAVSSTTLVQMAAADTTTLYVGPNQRYTTIDAAIAAGAAKNAPLVIWLDPAGTYTSAGGTWPSQPITIYGNDAIVTLTGTATVTGLYRAYDLNIVGNAVFAAPANYRYYLTGGSTTGNITLTSGLLHDEGRSLLGGTITVNGGTLEIISTVVTSQIVHTAGQLLIQNTNINATKSTAMISSTASAATSMMVIVNSLVYNLGTGTALDVSGNTQAVAHMNSIANSSFFTASAASVIGGSAVLEVTDCDYTITPTGTGYTGTNWGYLGARTLVGDLVPAAASARTLGSASLPFLATYGGTIYSTSLQSTAAGSSVAVATNVAAASVTLGTGLTSGTLTIGGTVQTGAANYSTGTGAQTVNLATGGTGVKTVNIATGAVADVLNVGSTLSINSVMGAFTTVGVATTLAATTNDNLYETGTAYALTLPSTLIGKQFTIASAIAYTIVVPSGVTLYCNGTSYAGAVTKTVATGYVSKLIQISATVWFLLTSATLS